MLTEDDVEIHALALAQALLNFSLNCPAGAAWPTRICTGNGQRRVGAPADLPCNTTVRASSAAAFVRAAPLRAEVGDANVHASVLGRCL
jgi:hypothetical protein